MANWKPAPVPEDQQVQQGPKSDLSELGQTGDLVAWGAVALVGLIVVISVLRWLMRERSRDVEQDDPLLRR